MSRGPKYVLGTPVVGIKAEHLEKVFDPFFTTKEVEKGTGQSLGIAHSVVVKRHGGRTYIESEVGKGTTFVINFPTNGSAMSKGRAT
jgi:signal transduction histidine kinase